MKPFRADSSGTLSAVLEPVEAALLSQLAGQVAGLLTESDPDDDQRNRALARLLPDAYADDPEASAEFRRFTSGDLTDRKVHNAHVVIEDVADAMVADGATEVRLDPPAIQAWLRSLTDIRLVLATRLGIRTDGSVPRDTDEEKMLGDVYDWLGWVQESLVSALDR